MNRHVVWFLISGLASCTGTDVGNPPHTELAGFETPGCKSKLPLPNIKGIGPASLSSALNDSRFDGLTCFVWSKRDETSLRIEVTNYPASCGVDERWKPSVRERSDGGIDLQLDNPGCVTAACGWCLYDLGFELAIPDREGSGSGGDGAVEIRLLGDACSGARRENVATLQLAAQTSGISCVYTDKNALQWHACTTGTAGSALTPCPDSCGSGSTMCDEGLVCSEVGSQHSVCLATCSSDADCDPSEVMRCRDGTCQLADP